jgi:hypothetical protein
MDGINSATISRSGGTWQLRAMGVMETPRVSAFGAYEPRPGCLSELPTKISIRFIFALLIWRHGFAHTFRHMALHTCQVSCRDGEGIEHTVHITAQTLYEAVAHS